MNNKHLLISYSWSINNIGDIGITPGLLNVISAAKPDLPVEVFAFQEEDNPDYQKVQAYLPQYKEHLTIHPNAFQKMTSTSQSWHDFVARWGEQKVENFRLGCLSSYESIEMAKDITDRLPLEIYKELEREYPDIARALGQAGFQLYNSGTTMNFGRLGVRNLWEYALPNIMPLLISRVLQVPYGINSQSFDALAWPMDLVFKELFQDARFVYCRDSDSLNYLHHCGLANKSSGFRPDSTFFFKGFDEEWAEGFMESNELKDKEFISVIVRISEPTPTFHDPTGGTISPERQVAQMEKMSQFITQWVRETGVKVLLCHEVRDTVELARERLWNLLDEKIRAHCVYLDHFWSSEQAYSILKRSRMLVSMDMHSVIMAINVGTPVIHIPYAEAGRKKWMLHDLGLSDWLIDIDDCHFEEIQKVALGIHCNYPKANQRIQELLPGLEARAKATLSEVWTHWKQ